LSSTVTAECRGWVFAIRLEGDGGNALSNADLARLRALFLEAATADCSVVTLVGAGEDFCRGRNHADVEHRGPTPPAPAELEARITRPVLDAFGALEQVRVPVIAAVQGRAWGLACALAGACDVTLAGSGASFRLPEMQRDLPPTLALSQLQRVIGRKALFDLVLRTQEISAQEALVLGLLTRVVADEQLGVALDEAVAELVARDRAALVTVKRYLRDAASLDGPAAADLASAMLSGVLATQLAASALGSANRAR
jgi:enoyl-CoA hydratase/carnithine racemase